jgi:prevent-host-death family protein
MMPTLDATKARDEFADTINRAAYGKERVILTRRGRELAAVVPIEDVRLLEELEGRLDIQEARATLAEAILLEQMLASSAAFLQARGCGALLWDHDTNRLIALTPFAGLEPHQAQRLAFPLDGAAVAPAAIDRRPILLNALDGASPDVELFKGAGFHTVVAAPLATQREMMGICLAFDKVSGCPFDDEDATVLAIMARQMAAVLDVTRRQRGSGVRCDGGRRGG